MFTFTPLLGAQSTSRASQSILELDGGVKVLVDVGWDESFDTRLVAELEKHISTLSFILLTHATTSHLGAFAHCCKHVPNFTQVPIYATSPVIAFGRTLLQDLYASSPAAATFIPGTSSPEDDTAVDDRTRTNILRQAPSIEDINKYFTLITPLKYSQPYQPTASQFSAPLEGLTLTAYNAGHTLGGTIWHIQHGMESIVYAVDWNQARENVIAGAAWFGGVGGSEVIEQLRNPTALVCSSIGGDKIGLGGGRKARDELLLNHIQITLEKGGSVLIPTDTSARLLELAWLLEKAWQEASNESVFRRGRVFMASKSANATLRHARSLLEWMDDSIVREFEGEDDAANKGHARSGSKAVNGQSKPSRPFDFQHVRAVERQTRLERVLNGEGPRVILASDLSLDWGLARQAFETMAQKKENLIVLTERSTTESVESTTGMSSAACKLWRWYEQREDGITLEKTENGQQLEQVYVNGRYMALHDPQKASLDPAENQKYQQYMATQRQLQEAMATNDASTATAAEEAMDDASSSSSEESDDEHQGRALNVSAALGHAGRNKVVLNDENLGVNILLRKDGVYDFDVRNKKGRNAVFPYTHTRKRGDEFGDFIKPEDFLREEEKEEQENTNESSAGILGQKRKWGDANNDKRNGQNKRQQRKREASADSVADADAGEDLDEEYEPEADDIQGPAKVVYQEVNVAVNSRLAFVDFAGLHDQRSLQMLIPLIGPKKLILTSGTAQEAEALAADARELLGMKIAGVAEQSVPEVFIPKNGQTIDASVDTNAWVVKLTRDLVKKLHWQNVKNMGIVTISGQLKADQSRTEQLEQLQDDPALKKQKLDTQAATQTNPTQKSHAGNVAEPVLDTLPPSLAAAIRAAVQPIHVGDLRLAELRRILSTEHTAEFRGEGTLLVDGIVAVRKQPNGKIVVEGVPVSTLATMNRKGTDSFAEVKRKIYAGLAVVAAG